MSIDLKWADVSIIRACWCHSLCVMLSFSASCCGQLCFHLSGVDRKLPNLSSCLHLCLYAGIHTWTHALAHMDSKSHCHSIMCSGLHSTHTTLHLRWHSNNANKDKTKHTHETSWSILCSATEKQPVKIYLQSSCLLEKQQKNKTSVITFRLGTNSRHHRAYIK